MDVFWNIGTVLVYMFCFGCAQCFESLNLYFESLNSTKIVPNITICVV